MSRVQGAGTAWLCLLLICVCLSAACNFALAEDGITTDTPAAHVGEKRLLIVGSSTIAPLIEELAKRFRRDHPGVKIQIEATGSGHGVRDTLSGRAAIGMVARPLKGKEKTLFVIPIARDGAALVVNRRNPVHDLSRDQARDIFSGRIDNWKSLGGPSQPIELLARAKSQGVTFIVSRYLDLPAGEMKPSEGAVLNDEVVSAVSSRPNTLSFLSIGVVEHAEKRGTPIKALALDGVQPGSDSIRNGSWPMARSLTLVARSVPMGLAQEFIHFILSLDTGDVIEAQGFIPY